MGVRASRRSGSSGSAAVSGCRAGLKTRQPSPGRAHRAQPLARCGRSRGRVGDPGPKVGFSDGVGRGGPVMMGGMGTPADAGDALAAQGHTPCLPEPTGRCPVGTTSLWLRDTSRPDPWAAGVNARELMVSLWYPATPSGGRAPIRSASTPALASPEAGPWTSPAPTSGPSSTSTCGANHKSCWTSRHHATPRSRSVPRRLKPARSTPARAGTRRGSSRRIDRNPQRVRAILRVQPHPASVDRYRPSVWLSLAVASMTSRAMHRRRRSARRDRRPRWPRTRGRRSCAPVRPPTSAGIGLPHADGNPATAHLGQRPVETGCGQDRAGRQLRKACCLPRLREGRVESGYRFSRTLSRETASVA